MVFQLDYHTVWINLQHAGYWFIAVLVLWFFLYMFNTASWFIIIKNQENKNKRENLQNSERINFWWLYKLSVSGFALNYATPCGLMGGEPYRIMELKQKIGVERATSSVFLFVMTHIFSHFWFWLLSIPLFIFTQHVSLFMAILLFICTVVLVFAIWFFLNGYKKGFTVRIITLLKHLPFFIGNWASKYIEKHHTQLENIDKQIATLHNNDKKTFLFVVLIELICRICSALEILFILLVLYPSVNYLNCILINPI